MPPPFPVGHRLAALAAAFAAVAAASPGGDATPARFRLSRRGVVGFAAKAPERVVLASNRSGTFQLYSLDLATGKTIRLTEAAAGKTTGAIDPTGRWVYWLADGGGSEVGAWMRVPFGGGPAERAFDAEGASTGIDFDRDGRFAVVGTSSDAGFRFERVAPGLSPRLLYGSKNEAYGPKLSADGRFLSLVETERKNDRHFAALVLDAATGARVVETRDPEPATVTTGPWSPVPGDERLVLHTDSSGFVRPEIEDVEHGRTTPIPIDLPGDVTIEGWNSDGRWLLAKQHLDGRDALYRWDLGGAALSTVLPAEGTVGGAWCRPDGAVWAEAQSAAAPTRLVEIDPRSGRRRTVLEGDRPPPGVALDRVRYRGADGDEVGALLGVPRRRNGAAVVWLHGGPRSETTDAFSPTIQGLLSAGYVVLAPNYHGSSGRGRAWVDSILGDPMRRELEDFRGARDLIVARKLARPNRILIAGWSYGGYGVLSALARQPDLWAGGVAGAPIADFAMQYEDARAALRGWTVTLFGGTPSEKPALYRDRSPLARADGIRAPVLIFAGRNDLRAPPRQIEAFVDRLRERKKPVEIRWFDAGHGSLEAEEQISEMRAMLAFMRKATKGE